VVHGAAGAITGFVAVQGAQLSLFDASFGNPVVLYTAPAAIAAAYRLGGLGISEAGAFFVVDGVLIHADFSRGTATPPLFTLSLPNERPPAVTTPSAFYFVDTAVTGSGAGASTTATLYQLPLDGGASPSPLAAEATRMAGLQAPVDGMLLYAVVPAGGLYTIKALATSNASVSTVFTASGNNGSFTAVGDSIYYTTSTRTQPVAKTFIFTDTRSGVLRKDGTVLLPELPNSRFAAAAERSDKLAVTRIFRVRGLAPVTTVETSTGRTLTDDGAAGGTLESIDTASNVVGPALGTVPTGSVAFLDAGLLGEAGFVLGSTRNSTDNPSTHELMFVNASQAGSLKRISSNLP